MSITTIEVNGVEYVPASSAPEPSPVKIVVLQRGWVVIGRHEVVSADLHRLTGASVIRRWGTTAGLGELVGGPKADTVLDPSGVVSYHPLAAVMTIDADEKSWAGRL